VYDLNKKFIFTHPPKCGGTSIENIIGFLELRNEYPNIHAYKHASLKMHIDKLAEKNLQLKDFFKFSIIRNPWDRAVSFYNHIKHKEYDYYTIKRPDKEMPKYVHDSSVMSFKEYVCKYYRNDFNSRVSTIPYMFFQNEFFLDYVIRLEHIEKDILHIKDKLQIDLSCGVPQVNNIEKFTTRIPYADYYDKETKNIIGKLFEWDINKFGYTF
jgi:chondroitin 4-sulfotransferase 11